MLPKPRHYTSATRCRDAETAQKAGVDFAGITHGMTTAEELRQYPHKKIMSSLEELLEREPLPAASPKNIGVRGIVLLLVFRRIRRPHLLSPWAMDVQGISFCYI